MLHNNGPYGPGDPSVNVGAPINMSQIAAPMNMSHNLGNLSKIAEQPTQAGSAHYNLPEYSAYNHPSLNMNPQMSPFHGYHPVGFPSPFIPQNSASIHDTSWQNGMLPMNLNIQSNQNPNLMNYPENFHKRPTEADCEDYKDLSLKKNLPINIPQVPMKPFHKVNNSDSYDLYNVNQDKFNHYNHDLDWNSKLPEKSLLDNTRRKSLENTVRLIENILINTTKNKDLQRSQEASNKISETINANSEPRLEEPKIEPLKEETEQMSETENDTKNNDNDHLSTNEEEVEKFTEKVKSDEESADDNTMETDHSSSDSEEDIKPDITGKEFIKSEDNDTKMIDIKIEQIFWTDSDFMNPFQHDVNGVTSEEVYSNIVDCENSVNEAIAVIKSGLNPQAHYECPHCSLLFSHPKRFLIHTKWHTFGLTNDKRMELARDREMRRNQRREARVVDRMNSNEVTDLSSSTKVHPCKDCDKVFSSKGSLKNHRQRFHPSRIRECKICQKTMLGWMALRAHLASHTNDSGYQCQQCDKKFKYPHSLAKHRDTHLEKTVACEQCPKMFGSAAQLKMHQKVHERAQRGATFSCSYCAKGFYEAYNLAVHERTHRNERPFLCEICNTSFGTNSSLKRHLKVSHSNAKPFECATCHRCFATQPIRDRHEMRVHGDPRNFKFHCDECDCRYLKLKDLQKHVYKAHPKGRKRKKQKSESE